MYNMKKSFNPMYFSKSLNHEKINWQLNQKENKKIINPSLFIVFPIIFYVYYLLCQIKLRTKENKIKKEIIIYNNLKIFSKYNQWTRQQEI